jgi:NADPH-dependent curcumin reductase
MATGMAPDWPAATVAQGIEAAPEAFIGLLKGRNFGKQQVTLV